MRYFLELFVISVNCLMPNVPVLTFKIRNIACYLQALGNVANSKYFFTIFYISSAKCKKKKFNIYLIFFSL